MNSLPPLDSLTSLKLLDVSLNQLTTLPDMSSLASLETLNLSLNKLDGELGPDAKLQGCTKLAVLEVTGTGVSILMSYGENPHYVKLPIFSDLWKTQPNL